MHIFAATILWDRWEREGDFRAAFCSWADDILNNYDEVKRRTRPINYDGWKANVSPEKRAALKGAHGNGVSFRMLADRFDLSLRQVVVVLRPGAAHHAESYAALEDEILAGGAPSEPKDGTWAELNQKHGFGVSTRAAQRLARAHGFPVPQTQRGGNRRKAS